MTKISVIFVFLICLFSTSTSWSIEPERAKGVSVHALPKRVAKMAGTPWGFEVTNSSNLKKKPENLYLQSVEDVLQYIKKQDQSVAENGLWVITTDPLSYSKEELELQKLLKETLPKHNIPVFWARGSERIRGFKRY